jgi:hypothetical protein
MTEVRKVSNISQRPCEVFDLIGGTGIGGLVAIMLGPLAMVSIHSTVSTNFQTLEECYSFFKELSAQVFIIDHVLRGAIPIGDSQSRFDYRLLESAIKEVIKRVGYDEECKLSDFLTTTHTFVVSKFADDLTGWPAIFRTYSTAYNRTSYGWCPLWMAARATCAVPTIFKAMQIHAPPGAVGGTYVDGSLGYSNPAELALEEAKKIWPHSKPACLVSIGHGLHDRVSLASDESNDDEPSWLARFLPAVAQMANISGGVTALSKLSHCCASLATDTEDVHRRLQGASDRGLAYFRFNVRRDIDVGFLEWHREKEIIAETEGYLKDTETLQNIGKCVTCLLNPTGTH